MARQPRVEYAGALHHVMSRGNDGIPIFHDDADRRLFLDLLAEEIVRSGWILHEYCLMTNHYHLEIETPDAVAETFDTTPAAIEAARGTLERRLVATAGTDELALDSESARQPPVTRPAASLQGQGSETDRNHTALQCEHTAAAAEDRRLSLL